MDDQVKFPILVKYEDGTIDTFNNIGQLETDLEVFDSASATDCEVRDACGRRVRLKVGDNLILEELSLLD
jgi:hypothetical protein